MAKSTAQARQTIIRLGKTVRAEGASAQSPEVQVRLGQTSRAHETSGKSGRIEKVGPRSTSSIKITTRAVPKSKETIEAADDERVSASVEATKPPVVSLAPSAAAVVSSVAAMAPSEAEEVPSRAAVATSGSVGDDDLPESPKLNIALDVSDSDEEKPAEDERHGEFDAVISEATRSLKLDDSAAETATAEASATTESTTTTEQEA